MKRSLDRSSEKVLLRSVQPIENCNKFEIECWLSSAVAYSRRVTRTLKI
jgi:hypothetical protein